MKPDAKYQTTVTEGIFGKSMQIFMAYKFIRILTTPFNKTRAFELGAIDEEGHLTMRIREMTPEQKESVGVYTRMVWKVKRLLGKLPFGRSRLASYAAALWFLKESQNEPYAHELEKAMQRVYRPNLLTEGVESFEPLHPDTIYTLTKPICDLDGAVMASEGLKFKIQPTPPICNVVYTGEAIDGTTIFPVTSEDVATNSSGGGSIAGVGDGSPPKPAGWLGTRPIFDVDDKTYCDCINGRPARKHYKKYIENPNLRQAVQKQGRKKDTYGVILRHKDTGGMIPFK